MPDPSATLTADTLAAPPAWRARAGWPLLLAISAALVGLLELAGLPAALLLGPMLGGVAVSGLGIGGVAIPKRIFQASQAVVGCMIAAAIPASVFGVMAKDWPIFTAGVVAVIVLSSALGWALTRLQVLPGTTAIWGASPGAATAMVILAESFGADIRLVAFMQYIRVVCVAGTAAIVARLFNVAGGAPALVEPWFPALQPGAFATTLAIALAGLATGIFTRIPAGQLLVPLFGGMALIHLAGLPVQLPEWLLAAAYAVIGWTIGLRFTRPILRHAARALPAVLGSTAILLAACAGLAYALHRFAGVDALTAYLAASPGGVDSVAIIAASSHVDMPFVMAMQTARFLLVMLTGPAIARMLARQG